MMGELTELHNSLEGALVIGLNEGESEAKVRAFVKEHNIQFPIVIGGKGYAKSLPMTIIAIKGSDPYQHVGYISADQIINILKQMVGEE